MARELIKTTREDATGFHKPKKSARESILKPLDESAVNSFTQKRQRVLGTPPEKTDVSPENPERANALQAQAAKEGDTASPSKDANTEGKSNPVVASSEATPDQTSHGLVDLVVPPRSKVSKALPLTLRLRILQRHVAPLEKLHSVGVDVENVMKAAHLNLPAIKFEPRYVPQVAEPSGFGGWGCRLNTRINPETLQAIQAQVRGGETAPRSTLVLGQIEPAWFSSLDQAIKDFSK